MQIKTRSTADGSPLRSILSSGAWRTPIASGLRIAIQWRHVGFFPEAKRMMHRPLFHSAWAHFRQINVPVGDVGRIIGGKVRVNIDSGTFPNACPIRMSYVLNRTGFPVNKNLVPLDDKGRLQVSSGDDGLWYIFRVNPMIEYLRKVFGAPDVELARPPITASVFLGMKGILIVTGRDGAMPQAMSPYSMGQHARIPAILLAIPRMATLLPKRQCYGNYHEKTNFVRVGNVAFGLGLCLCL